MIAILGATGTIGLSLARALSADPRGLVLFARRPHRLANESFGRSVGLRPLDEFTAADYDLVINAIGAGDPGRVAGLGADILEITERWDRRILDTMGARTRYVFLSSGAVYGTNFAAPVSQDSELSLPINDLASVSPYIFAKLITEFRHRHLPDRSILDVRVFAYADITLPREGRFFLSELAQSIRSRSPFKTSPADMVRDYAGSTELAALITCWEESGARNTSLDLYTKAPARKKDILDIACERYSVEIQYCADASENRRDEKSVYASQNRAAAAFGYKPTRSAIEVVVECLDCIAQSNQRPEVSS